MKTQRYIPPASHPLHPYVQSLFFGRGRHVRELVLPKCNVDILFNLGDPIRIERTERHASGLLWQKTLVVGLQTRAIVAVPQGVVRVAGISLTAATCRAVLPLPLGELTDLAEEGVLLFPEIDGLWERLGATHDLRERCRLLLSWLASRITPPSQAALIRCACNLLHEDPDVRRIDQVAQASSVSFRHLRRLFRQHVGVGPAEFMRLSRFSTAIHLMKSPLTLTEIAHEAHYYDQAHFCRDFREIAGVSPGQYRREAGPVPGHVFYPGR